MQTSVPLLQAIADRCRDGVYAKDESGRFIFMNPVAERMMGVTAGDVLGKTSSDLDLPGFTKSFSAAEKHVIETGEVMHGITTIKNPDKDLLIEQRVSPYLSDGKIAGIIVNLCDITYTADSLSHSKMLESEAKYRDVFEGIPLGYGLCRIVLDENDEPVDYIFLEVNGAFETVTGLTAADVIGRPVTKVVPGIENSEADWISKYGDIALNGGSHQFEQYDDVMDTCYRVYSYRPTPKHFVMLFDDITKLHRKERELEESEEKLSNMRNASPDAVLMARMSDGVFVEANEKVFSVFGYSPSEVIGKNSSDLDLGVSLEERSRLSKLMLEKGAIEGLHISIKTKTGELVEVEHSARLIDTKSGLHSISFTRRKD